LATVECQWVKIWKKFMKYVFIHFLTDKDFYTIRQILEGNIKQNIKISNCSQAILLVTENSLGNTLDSVLSSDDHKHDELRAYESTFGLPSMPLQISGRYISTLAMPHAYTSIQAHIVSSQAHRHALRD